MHLYQNIDSFYLADQRRPNQHNATHISEISYFTKLNALSLRYSS